MNSARYLALGIITMLVAFAQSAPILLTAQASTTLIISEVHPGGSGNSTYGADWFEVTNTGTTVVDVTNWTMDDNSNALASAVALNGVAAIAPGQSVVFIETTTPTNLAAFTAAWFGSNPPSGLVIGTYGGSGVGLGNGGDAVNLFDRTGNRITGISFGAATPTATFDNTAGAGSATLPLPTVATVSVAGVNGAFQSASGAEIGSPGRRVAATPMSTLDLSLYVRVGRFDLPEPTRTAAPVNSLLAQEVSAVTYNWDTDSLFVVGDGGTSIVQVTKTGQLVDSMTLAQGSSPQGTEFYDPEGLTYVGNGRFVLSEERDRQAVLFTYAAGATLTRTNAQTVKLGTFVDNIGIEGISYDPLTGGFIAAKEIQPQGLFQTGIDFAAATATNGSPTAVNSTNLFNLVEPFAGLLDFADVYALSNLPSLRGPESTHLLVLSQESGRIVHIDRFGQVLNSLTIMSDPDNPLSVSAQQHEGLTMDGDGRLYVVSENGGGDFDHPQLWVYEQSTEPNQPPTDLTLENAVRSIAEHTNTASRLKVADVVVTDDGLGTNNLTVTGSDAGAFEVDSTGLFIKAGTILDFETKSVYNIVVELDDPTSGTAPDATALFVLTLTDVVTEVPAMSTLVISEVAPWSSGNSPYGADWFELTNIGGSVVDIAGWKVDDSSESSAAAVPLAGVASIAPGESVIFIETASPASTAAAFRDTWFGANSPSGLQIGSYTGGGIGLSTGGDAVNIYTSAGQLHAKVFFGVSSGGPVFATFDNAAGLNNAALTELSTPGVQGAFTAANNANEVGSPGTIGTAANDDDADGDGIGDQVDPFPVSAGNETFSDALAPLSGSTSGVIMARNGHSLAIVDATPNPGTGVEVVVSGAGGGSVDIRLDGKTGTISLPAGTYTLTDPVATTTVSVGTGGPARVAMVLNGLPAVLVVGSGSSVTFTETIGSSHVLTGLAIDAVAGTVTLNGAAIHTPMLLVGPPQTADACRMGGWHAFNFPVTFRNQAECVSYLATSSKPPTVKVPGHLRLEATAPSGTVATFIATALDPVDGPLPVSCTPASGSMFPLGETTVTCSATNLRGTSDSGAFRVWVRDTISPDIVRVTPSVAVLPDTNQPVPVSIAVEVVDIADPAPSCRIVRVTGQGRDLDRDAVIDWTITGDLALNIAANARRHRDRTYTITVRCSDATGNASRDRAAVVISREH